MPKVYVKRIDNAEVVKEIEVRYSYDSSMYDRFLMGLMRNMDTDRFYVDDSEVETGS